MNEYEATELHLHAPSEHKVNGVQMDLEMHIVFDMTSHVEHDRNTAALGFLFLEDDTVEDIDLFTQILSNNMDSNDEDHYTLQLA
jgi:carbonic anhydrase